MRNFQRIKINGAILLLFFVALIVSQVKGQSLENEYPVIPKDTVGNFNYNSYMEYAKIYADTLINAAPDRYGRFHTPMFMMMLNLYNHQPITKKDAPNWQSRYNAEDFMKGARGINLYWDIDNLRALYRLSKYTGNSKYAKAADAYLKSFFKHGVSPFTGLFAWGEHMYWNAFLDTIVAQRHELKIPLPYWEMMWKLNPKVVTNEINAIYKINIVNHKTFMFDRHANWWTGIPDEASVRGAWIKHSGLFAYSFAFMYTKTHDPKYLKWLKGISSVFWKIKNPKNDLIRGEANVDMPSTGDIQLLSYYLIKAYQLTPQKYLLHYASTYMKALARLSYDPSNKKFYKTLNVHSGTPTGGSLWNYMPVWDDYGAMSKFAYTLELLYKLTKDPFFLDYSKKAVKYIEETPIAPTATPQNFGRAIRTFATLYEITKDVHYLHYARYLSNMAISKLFVNGLFKESINGYIYNGESDPGSLERELINMYMLESKLPVHWEAPLSWSAPSEPIKINVKFSQAESPRKVELHYNFKLGKSGVIEGFKNPDNAYSFNLKVPSSNYEGVVNFWIKWRDKNDKWQDSKNSAGIGSIRINKDSHGPYLSGLTFPEINPNTAPIPVKVRVKDEYGIKQVSLNYRYSDGRTGSEGCWKAVYSGDEISWNIPAPGKCFEGKTQFWVEAWGNQNDPVKTVSKVQTVYASRISVHKYSAVASEEKELDFPVLGAKLKFQTAANIPDVSVQIDNLPFNPEHVSKGLPEIFDTAFIAERYYSISAPKISGKLNNVIVTLPYDKAQEDRLVISTISIYKWNGSEWEKVPSKINEDNNTVTANLSQLGTFAISGQSRLKWRRTFNGAMQVQPVVADLFGDGNLEIITNSGESDHRIYAMDSKGDIIWSYSLSTSTGFDFPVVADVNGDGHPEIIAGSESGDLYVLNNHGKLEWKYIVRHGAVRVRGGRMGMSVAVGDLFGDGHLEIVSASGDGYVYAFNGKGKLLWKTNTGSGRSIPTLADLYNNGKLEIVVGSGDEDNVCVLNNTGKQIWKIKTNGYITYGVAVGDMNNDGHKEIVFNARRNQIAKVWAVDANGHELWTYPCDGNGDWSVSLADMQNDGKLEAILNNVNQHDLTLVDGHGKVVRNIPITSRNTITPAILDLNGDGKLDLIISGNDDRHVHAIDNSGKELWEFLPISPMMGGAKVKGGGTPAVADIDGSGKLDVMFGDDETWFYSVRTGTSCTPHKIAVNQYNGNMQHTAVYHSPSFKGYKTAEQ